MKIAINDGLLYFDVENPSLAVDKNGIHELPSMIILHGGPGYDHTPYKTFFSALRDTVQIIYLDQHGNGRSDPGSPASWNFERWTNDIYQFCQAIHINQPIIFGHSFGGNVALEYAIRYPNALSKLILCSTTAKLDLDISAESFFRLGGQHAKQVFLDFFNNPTDETKKQYALHCSRYMSVQKIDEQSIFYNRLKLKMDIQNYFFTHLRQTYDCINRIKNIKKPTLVLSGEQDPLTTVEMGQTIANHLGNHLYKYLIVPDTSHNLIWEKTTEVMNSIEEFITFDNEEKVLP